MRNPARSRRWARQPSRLVASILLLVAACSRDPSPTGTPVQVTLHDFRIDMATTSVPSGTIDFEIGNPSPTTHEFVLVRTDLPADGLPIAADGLSVDEDELRSMGEISEVDTGTDDSLPLTLAPGHYVYFCNLEGHYLGGMHGSLEVTADATP